jgi:hypothetical protein
MKRISPGLALILIPLLLFLLVYTTRRYAEFDSLFAYQYFDGREDGGDMKWHDISPAYRLIVRERLIGAGVTNLVMMGCRKFSPLDSCEVRVIPKGKP